MNVSGDYDDNHDAITASRSTELKHGRIVAISPRRRPSANLGTMPSAAIV